MRGGMGAVANAKVDVSIRGQGQGAGGNTRLGDMRSGDAMWPPANLGGGAEGGGNAARKIWRNSCRQCGNRPLYLNWNVLFDLKFDFHSICS